MTTNARSKTIKVDALARVEGEGGLTVQVRGGKVSDVKLRIYEPPRFFEAFLRGRDFREAPDITARICGICPVAYQMSAVHAMEEALRRQRRRPAARAAPAALLRRVDREPRAARLHAARAGLPRLRERHPHGGRPRRRRGAGARAQEDRQRPRDPGRRPRDPPDQRPGRRLLPRARPGGSSAPLAERLKWARDARARDRALGRRRSSSPTSSRTTSSSSLRHPDEYPFNEGRIVSSQGLDIAVRSTRSTSSRSTSRTRTRCTRVRKGRGRVPRRPAGPLQPELRPAAAGGAGGGAGGGPRPDLPQPVPEHRGARGRDWSSPATRRCGSSTRTSRPTGRPCEVTPRDGTGHGCTEAPRGILYHRYRIDAEGLDRRRRRSSRRRRRTRRRSRTTSGASCRSRPRPARRRAHAGSASRRSATTTPASPARRTS